VSTLEHEPQSHHLAPEVVASQQRRAVLFFILADAVFFASMLFTYFYLHSLNVNDGWLPDGAHTASAGVVWLVAAVTVASALAYWSAERGIRSGQRSRFLSGCLLGLILVVAAIALVIYQARTWPIYMSDGSYASIFIVMVGVQFAHLLVLVVLAIGIWNRGNQGKFDEGRYTHVTLVGYYWYWVALTAVLGACTTFFTS